MRRTRGFTIVELLVVMSIISVMMSMLLPSLGGARKSAQTVQNATQMRDLHTGTVMFSHANRGHYMGVNSQGALTSPETYLRFGTLLTGQYITGRTAVSPVETGPVSTWTSGSAVGKYSYAMLVTWNLKDYYLSLGLSENSPLVQGTDRPKRLEEWRDTGSSKAIVAADRAIANWNGNSGQGHHIKSVHTNPAKGVNDWRGHVVWNDNHVTFESSPQIASTRYGEGSSTNFSDDLFRNTPDSHYRTSSMAIYNVEADAYLTANNWFGGASTW
jgi:prepilin-type N-terminal cleavage/methylation domain-containing protein